MNINNFKKTKDKVKFILEKYPEARDSYSYLYFYFLYEKYGFDMMNNLSVVGIKSKLLNNNFETISRARRQTQKENPLLRGKSYQARKENEKEVSEFFSTKHDKYTPK